MHFEDGLLSVRTATFDSAENEWKSRLCINIIISLLSRRCLVRCGTFRIPYTRTQIKVRMSNVLSQCFNHLFFGLAVVETSFINFTRLSRGVVSPYRWKRGRHPVLYFSFRSFVRNDAALWPEMWIKDASGLGGDYTLSFILCSV